MGDVVQFPSAKPEIDSDNFRGEVICLHCSHTWNAVAPAETEDFECPECHTFKGVWRYLFAPPYDLQVWHCDCGNTFFWMTKDGHFCPKCGTYQRYD